jgi:hypothetical protein
VSDGHVLHPSHSFVLRTIAGEELDVGPVVNWLLTTRRNHRRAMARGDATAMSQEAAAAFEMGVNVTIHALCGSDGCDAFKSHCEELWELSQEGMLSS